MKHFDLPSNNDEASLDGAVSIRNLSLSWPPLALPLASELHDSLHSSPSQMSHDRANVGS